jgi:hypothetical protein
MYEVEVDVRVASDVLVEQEVLVMGTGVVDVM